MACLALPYFSTLSYKVQDDQKTVIVRKLCFIFLQYVSERCLILKRVQQDITKEQRSSLRVPTVLIRLLGTESVDNLPDCLGQRVFYCIRIKINVRAISRAINHTKITDYMKKE